ncbi:polysaccharide deacetylase family protein [Rhizobium sp. FY34]|uniref:polysaccharide deacetylase family protein n=1 Tax=Rhizobium sp. FY34 TaxID=2562309 RepID=UPI0010BFF04F|nr:polysaccharide deacetylase family protein [Rhizobium sp. FY34]
MNSDAVKRHLDRLAGEGKSIRFWLRDDDAVQPTPALQRLLALTAHYPVPLVLAVIPEETGVELADLLSVLDHVRVAVHGWSHCSYSIPPAKKQELGLDRPITEVLAELQAGFAKLQSLYGLQFEPMLVPPWNRIAPEIVDALPALGFESLSVFGREKQAVLSVLNTHVDLMDWRGTGGGKPADQLFAEVLACMIAEKPVPSIGVLAHHLVHDDNAWAFLEQLFALTAAHPACRWVAPGEMLRARAN